MEKLAQILQAVGYHAVQVQPLLPTYIHLILSALFPIFAGAHASLYRPSSAAKPLKRTKEYDEDDEPEEGDQKMEGMSPSDAIILPIFAGLTLTGLYFLIKWLEDPVLLNQILNWYYSLFGVLALTRLMTDTIRTLTSFVFPGMYTAMGQMWMINAKDRAAYSNSAPDTTRDSPLPWLFASLPLPKIFKQLLWSIRDLESHKLQIRCFVRNLISANFKIGPQDCVSFLIAFIAQLYFNLIGKPWWLTNALGFGFAYSVLQLLSPTDSLTGTLVLCALFVYDIYFVFFTPLMVTVATKLDIPAKLLFPRPSGPRDDPTKQHLSMLGLGDIILPGMMIGFALRFDLYLYYLRKQTRKETKDSKREKSSSNDQKSPNTEARGYVMEKDTYYPATSGWGEKFWSTRRDIITSAKYHGTIFPKPYFYATMNGYVFGMLLTLGVMQIYGHAQPALLYLVPGVLGALWGTALVKGEIGLLWHYSEVDPEEEKNKETEVDEGKKNEQANERKWTDWKSIFWPTKKPEPISKKTAAKDQNPPPKRKTPTETTRTTRANNHKSKHETEKSDRTDPSKPKQQSKSDVKTSKGHEGTYRRNRENELLFLSVNFPSRASKEE